jgi:hypothetical protein
MAKQKLNQSPGGLNSIIEHHLRYEVQMLRYTHRRLGVKFSNKCEENACIESFCIHARNLIDFLGGKLNDDGKYAAASHFADGYSVQEVPGKLYGKLSEQIVHITYNRSDNDEEKLGPDDRKRLFELIDKEIQIFIRRLKEQYRPLWQEPEIPAIDTLVVGPTNATATSSVGGGYTGTWRGRNAEALF